MKRIIALAATMCLGLALCACTSQGSSAASDGSGTGEATQDASGTTTQSQASTETTGGITEDEARSIALADAGVAENDVVAMHVSRSIDHGQELYEIEFFANMTEYDYEISAADGTIYEKDLDAEYDFSLYAGSADGQSQGSASASEITRDEAAAIALARVSGATTDNISLHYEIDDGRTAYEGKIIYNQREYEFEIDAATGTVIEWEEESVWD